MQDTGSLGLVHWDDPEGWYGEGGGRRGSGWGTHVHPWQMHVDVWQNQYNIVKENNNNNEIKKKTTTKKPYFGAELECAPKIPWVPCVIFLPLHSVTTLISSDNTE